jgi:hypothetical protein
MGLCPCCHNELVWQNDWEDDFDEEVYYSMWSCFDCSVDVTQRFDMKPSDE